MIDDIRKDVITSYSIHYTKLYDVLIRLSIQRESFTSIDAVARLLISIVDDLIDDENRGKYDYRGGFINIPLEIDVGEHIDEGDEQRLRDLGIV